MRKEIKVFLVVDPTYAERIFDLPLEASFWVVETDVNAPVVHKVWLQNSEKETDTTTTLFKTDLTLPPEKQVINVLEQIDLHHGACSTGVPYTVLEVIGCETNEEIQSEIAEYGFTITEKTSGGFIAEKPEVQPSPRPARWACEIKGN